MAATCAGSLASDAQALSDSTSGPITGDYLV